MQKWMWVLLIGGLATWWVNKTHSSYTWIVAGLTALATFFMWKKG